MTRGDQSGAPSKTPPRRGLAEKRQAILDGALTVFARDGYTRAGMEVIAKEAGVSTRTIYNHFDDKEQLFLTVILESNTRVRDAQIAQIQRHLGKVVDLKTDLVALARDSAGVSTEFDAHFALVRQIYAEARHIPADVLRAWQETGPRAVHAELAHHLARLAEQGQLQISDPTRAAFHFFVLISTEVNIRSVYGALPLDDTETDDIVTSGVATFLRAYRH